MKLLFLRVGLACNNRCVMCAGTWTPQETLPLCAMIEKLKAGAAHGFSEVIISGGEPTIQPDLLRFLKKKKLAMSSRVVKYRVQQNMCLF